MPSQKTAETKVKTDLVKCEVIRAIGIEADPETLKKLKERSERKGLKFNGEGLTTMIYPNKPVRGEDGKTMVPGEKVFVDLERDVARKLQNVGAVRVVV